MSHRPDHDGGAWTPPSASDSTGLRPIKGVGDRSVVQPPKVRGDAPNIEVGPNTGAWYLRPQSRATEAKENVPSSFYRFYDKSELEAAYSVDLNDNERLLFDIVSDDIGGRYGGSGQALFSKYVTQSDRESKSGIRKSPVDILFDVAMKRGILGDDGVFEIPEKFMPGADGKKKVKGKYTGPVATTTMANERDLRMTADALGSDIFGRAVTDEEFQRVLKKVRQAEKEEPTVSQSGTAFSTSQPGLSAQGRQNIMRDALAQGPEAEEFTKATDMMGFFYEWLEGRPG